jgi:hypothetical protein
MSGLLGIISKKKCGAGLKYQTIDDRVAPIGLPRESLCLDCWTGDLSQKTPPDLNVPAPKPFFLFGKPNDVPHLDAVS